MTPIPPSILTAKDHHPPLVLLPHLATILSPPVNDLRSDFLSGASGEAERLMTTWGHSDMHWTDVWGPSVPGWREPEGRSAGELVCLDSLYFASERGESVMDLYIGGSTGKGPWAMVGRHLRWHPKLEAQAQDVVRAVLGLAAGTPLPQLLTIHIRRTDFLPACYGEPWCALSQRATYLGRPSRVDTLPTSSRSLRVVHYERRLHDVQAQLAAAGFDDVKSWPVLVTTDEADPTCVQAHCAALPLPHSLVARPSPHVDTSPNSRPKAGMSSTISRSRRKRRRATGARPCLTMFFSRSQRALSVRQPVAHPPAALRR